MRHPASGDNHSMPDLAHDTRQKRTFTPNAAMYKHAAWLTARQATAETTTRPNDAKNS